MSELHAPLIHADVIPQKRIESLQFDARINGVRFATFKRVNESLHIYSVKKRAIIVSIQHSYFSISRFSNFVLIRSILILI